MKTKKTFLYCTAIAATMLAFTACSNDDTFPEENVAPVETPTLKGSPLTISASIGNAQNNAKTRLVSSESANGIKLSWEIGDKLYMMTSTDGSDWATAYYSFQATVIDTDASKATFVCDDFTFPTGTTKVKFVYTSKEVSAAADLDKSAQNLSEQRGTIANVANYIHMETGALDAASEVAVKPLVTTLVQSNAVMRVTLAKSDIEWGNDYFPAEITMKLQSTSLTLKGATDNTVTIRNTTNWNAEDQITANIVVCMDGTVSTTDRWIFTMKDGLGNSLIKATTSAKVLQGGKRYNAHLNFTTENYFPLLAGYFNPSIWETGALDESQKTFATGAYGFAGWTTEANGYPTGWNLSNYNYLVLKFANGSQHIAAGANFRMYDEASYWATQSHTACDKDQIVIDLTQEMKKWSGDNETSDALDITKVAIIGFWSFGPDNGVNRNIILDKMYLTNTDPTDNPSGDGNTNITTPGIDDAGEDAF